MACTVRVERQHQAWVDRARSYTVVLDGRKVGKLRNGQAAEYAISPGAHVLQVRLDWSGSQRLAFDTLDGDRRTFTIHYVGNVFGRTKYLRLATEGKQQTAASRLRGYSLLWMATMLPSVVIAAVFYLLR